jgi:hypothetical protein
LLGDGPVSSATAAPGSALWTRWQFWVVLVGVLALIAALLSPAVTRLARRRRRLRDGRAGPDPIWAELADTADDLGYVWSPARSPRQVLSWLSGQWLPTQAMSALQTITQAVETSRYAEVAGPPDPALIADLREVERALRLRQDWRQRLEARLLPRSVHWVRQLRRWRTR